MLLINKPIGIRGKDISIRTSEAYSSELKRRLRINQKDSIRKKLPFNFPIYFMWYHFLRLALELERLEHCISVRSGRGVTLSNKRIRISRELYEGWDLNGILEKPFHQWCSREVRAIAREKLKYSGKPQYDSLAKAYNVYVRYLSGQELLKSLGRTEFGYRMVTQWEAARYVRVRRDTNKRMSDYGKVFWKDVKAAESVILSVCEGKFP